MKQALHQRAFLITLTLQIAVKTMREEILSIKNEALAQVLEADSLAELDEIKLSFLGRQGKITVLFKTISSVGDKKEKRAIGQLLNDSKISLEQAIAQKRNQLKSTVREWFDPTIPGEKMNIGNIHIVSRAIEEISQIFKQIGFVRVRYPEVEWDWYSFESLNIPKGHPARDEWETFFVDGKQDSKLGNMVLSPHTSSGQVREMERTGKPPIRMINIAKCYRRQSDQTHYPMFHQFEGLVVDEGINITHLKGTIDYFARQFYGTEAKSRIRPFNFRFTEPSFEVDFSCVHCAGRGCKFCKSGWHEVGGAGMVHPNVLKAGNIDPNKYSGFAFGWGVERTLLLRPDVKIDDIRTVYDTSLNTLEQF